jgi:hypothetical protein
VPRIVLPRIDERRRQVILVNNIRRGPAGHDLAKDAFRRHSIGPRLIVKLQSTKVLHVIL